MSLMLAECRQAPQAAARVLAPDAGPYADLAARLRRAPPSAVVTIARGSSDHAAAYGGYLIMTRLGAPVASLPPSIYSVEHARMRLKGCLVVAVSQSGQSPDIVAALRGARADGALCVAIVNQTDSPLAEAADHVLPQHAGAETSVAATKSYIASLAALARLVAEWSEDAALTRALHALPERLRAAADGASGDALTAFADAEHAFVIARGAALPIAQEAALKLKETCALQAEAFSAAEVRHGPQELAGPPLRVLAIMADAPAGRSVAAVAERLQRLGARVTTVGPDAAAPTPPPLHPLLDPIVAIQALYPAINGLALMRGRDPDRPAHLAKVTRTT